MRYGSKERRSTVRNDWARTMSKMGMILVAGSLALACPAGAGTAPAGRGVPKVVSGPTVSKTGTAYSMSFEVDRPCDVTVRVLNSKGEVVRHLASGMVGLAKAAEPLKAKSF